MGTEQESALPGSAGDLTVPARRLVLMAVSTVLLSSGCLGFWVRTPGEIEDLQADQSAMADELDQLAEAVAENESLLRGLQAQSGTRTADLLISVSPELKRFIKL